MAVAYEVIDGIAVCQFKGCSDPKRPTLHAHGKTAKKKGRADGYRKEN